MDCIDCFDIGIVIGWRQSLKSLGARIFQLIIDSFPGAVLKESNKTRNRNAAPDFESDIEVSLNFEAVPLEETTFSNICLQCLFVYPLKSAAALILNVVGY